jgi:hypothetical protein
MHVALLSQIMALAAAHNKCLICWLSGLAGTGKSTMTGTIAHWCASHKQIDASFFFRHGSGNLASLCHFTITVAMLLAAVVLSCTLTFAEPCAL